MDETPNTEYAESLWEQMSDAYHRINGPFDDPFDEDPIDEVGQRASEEFGAHVRAFYSLGADADAVVQAHMNDHRTVMPWVLERLAPEERLRWFPAAVLGAIWHHDGTDLCRRMILEMPRAWVLERIEAVMEPHIHATPASRKSVMDDLTDWALIFELYRKLDHGLARRYARRLWKRSHPEWHIQARICMEILDADEREHPTLSATPPEAPPDGGRPLALYLHSYFQPESRGEPSEEDLRFRRNLLRVADGIHALPGRKFGMHCDHAFEVPFLILYAPCPVCGERIRTRQWDVYCPVEDLVDEVVEWIARRPMVEAEVFDRVRTMRRWMEEE